MKRSEIINQLLKEGFSTKTLINFSDKQLQSLSSRITEAFVASDKEMKMNPNLKANVSNLAKTDDVKIVPESKKNVKESGVPGLKAKVVKETGVPGLKTKEVKESGVPGLNAKSSSKLKNGTSEKEMKESGVPGLKAKSSGKLKNGTSEKEIKESGVPGLKAKKSSGELKNGTVAKEVKEAAGAMPGLTVGGKTNISKPVSKPGKEEGEEDINEKENNDKGKSPVKKNDKNNKGGEDKHKAFIEMLKKKQQNKNINEWVENVAKKHYHPFTTKNEIMEMITSQMDEIETDVDVEKLPEFLKFNSIKNNGAAPAPAVPKTTPGTKPGQNPRPKTPYKPGPGINPAPKAMGGSKPKA